MLKEHWSVLFPDDLAWFSLELIDSGTNKGILLGGRWLVDTSMDICDRTDMQSLLEWMIESLKKCVEMISEGIYTKYVEKNLPYRHR